MNIYFTVPKYTIEIVGNDLKGLKTDIDTVRLPPEAKKILHYLKEFIEQRLQVLKDEINNEETENEDIYTLMNFNNDPLVIQYLGYSHNLTSKMEDAITPEDMMFVEKVLIGAIQI